MSQKGITLIELLIAMTLLVVLGLTVVHLDFLSASHFRRTHRGMEMEQEVEMALGQMARDIVMARTLDIFNGWWGAPEDPGDTGDRMELSIDDNMDIPPDPSNDDVIRYRFDDATNQIIRLYAVDGGAFDGGRPVARNIDLMEVTQTVEQPGTAENLPHPQNVIRVMVRGIDGPITVERTRYINSRALRAGDVP